MDVFITILMRRNMERNRNISFARIGNTAVMINAATEESVSGICGISGS